MRKINSTIFILVVVCLAAAINFSFLYQSGSPGGYSSSPGDNNKTCANCHSGTVTTVANWITTTIPSDGYTPGTTYSITVTGTQTGTPYFGFESTAENSSNVKVGTFTITNSTETKLVNGNKAVTQKSAGTTASGGTKSWSYNWTAPSGEGEITFYASLAACNGSGTSGDTKYKTSLTVQLAQTVNQAPSFTSNAVIDALEGHNYTYPITVSDPDVGATLTITAPTLPSWLTFNVTGTTTASLSGNPQAGDVGSHNVILEVSDGIAAAVQQTFTITVSANAAPVFTSSAITTVAVNQTYTYNITTNDADADLVAVSCTTLPAWLNFTDNGNGTATLSGTPTSSDEGTHAVVLEITDGIATPVQQSFDIQVTSDNEIQNPTQTNSQINVVQIRNSASGFIELSLRENSLIDVNIYNSTGLLINSIVSNKQYTIGNHQINFNVGSISSSVYLIETKINGKSLINKIYISK